MSKSISNSNSELDALTARLKEIRMPSYERIHAEAQLARAEALAEAIATAARFVKRLLRALILRPIRRLAATFG
jgi:hypothetical protein